MSSKILLFFLTILSFLSSISALVIPTTYPASVLVATEIDHASVATNFFKNSDQHFKHTPQSMAMYGYTTNNISQETSTPQTTTTTTSNNININTSTQNNHQKNTPQPRLDPTSLDPKTQNTTIIDGRPGNDGQLGNHDTADEEEKWYNAPWITIATWALWLYIFASALGLLALWGRGVIERSGEWVNVGGEVRRVSGRGGGMRRVVVVDEGRALRRMGVL